MSVIPNGLTMPQLEAFAKDLGEQAGKGKDTQIKFLLKIVEASFHGAIDLKPGKHNGSADDAEYLAEIYVKAQSGAAIFDAKAPNQRKTISCMRTCVKLGQYPKGGPSEPMTTVNNLMDLRRKLRANPQTSKKLDDAANTLLRYARAQIKSDAIIDQSDLGAFCNRPLAQTRDGEQILEGIQKQLRDLVHGKASHGMVKDDSTQVKQALRLIGDRLTDINKANNAKKGNRPVVQMTAAA